MGTKWFGASVKRKEDPALLPRRGPLRRRHPAARHAARRVRAQPARARRHPRHRQDRGARDARRARGAHLSPICRSRCGARPCRCWCRTRRSSSRSCRTASRRTRSATPASRSRCVIADSRYIAEDAADAGRGRVRAAAGGDRLPRRARSRARRSRTRIADPTSPRVIPVKVGDTDARVRAGARTSFARRSTSIAAGRSSSNAAAWSRATTPSRDALTLYVSSQGPHRHEALLLDMFDLGDHQVRVVTPDVGGGFGPKGSLLSRVRARSPSPRCALRPAGEVDRGPAREFPRDPPGARPVLGHGDRGRRDAKILGVRGTLIHETGAYVPWGIVLPWITATTVPGPYVIPQLQARRVGRVHQQDPDHAGARRGPARRRSSPWSG